MTFKAEALEAVLKTVSLADLREFQSQTDRLCWIEYTLCDPNNLPRRYAEAFETKLLERIERASEYSVTLLRADGSTVTTSYPSARSAAAFEHAARYAQEGRTFRIVYGF